MFILRHIFRYEWLNFIRNKFHLLLVVIILSLGCYAVYYGYSEMEIQKHTIAAVQLQDHAERLRIQKGARADTSTSAGKKEWQLAVVTPYVWHRQFYAATFAPDALAALAIGQRDLQPYYYKLTAMSLYYQLFQNEIANPQKLLVGNFDLSFVLIYLFPLLIIAFCYSLLSAEKDRGLLNLLKSQAAPMHRITLIRLFFYFLIIWGLGLVLSLTGFAVVSVNSALPVVPGLLWIVVMTAYFLFWFAVLFLILSFNSNSSFNAIAGIGSWLFFLIIIPATLNVIIGLTRPLNSSVLSGISRRTGVFNEENEDNQKKVLSAFFRQYPELNSGPQLYRTNLTTKGFAAFTVLNDQKSAALVYRYQDAVQKREETARRFDYVNPAVNAQTLFNAIAKSDLRSFRRFYEDVKDFHHQLIAFYYPRLFADELLTPADLERAPAFRATPTTTPAGGLWSGLAALLISCFVLSFIGYRVIKSRL